MAKKKAGVNKSKAIRDWKQANPRHKPKQIAAALGKKGIKVTPGFVSTILSTSKKKKTIGKPGRPKGSRTVQAGRSPKPSTEISYESLLKVKQIVREMGGIEDARSALTALEHLLD
jgi:hypothetical protein